MLEKQIATQVGKVTGGLINAMLKPQVNRIEKWAQDKDLSRYIDSDDLQKRINEYLEKLAIRVSQMTSVIFPRKTLKLDDIYEPIGLYEYKSNKKFNLVDEMKSFDMNYLIIDGAGMGKSTFSKYLTSQILFKYDRVPIFYELRKTKGDLIDELANELDFLGDAFDRVVFEKLLHKGKFVIILDGFDEVGLELQQETARNINDLTMKGGKNSVLVTSREQDLLPELLNCKPLQFSSLNLKQVKSILNKLDKYTNLKVGFELIEKIDLIPDSFLKSPLSINLLYQTYGMNYSISKSKSTFYQQLFNALYDGHDLKNKNGFIREKKSKLDSDVFQKVLRTLCYSMTVKNKVSFDNDVDATLHIEESIKRAKIENISAYNFLDDLLIAVPLLMRDGQEIKFIHKTIMEYFSSQFLIFHPDRVKRINHIVNNVKSNNFDAVIDFIYHANEDLYHDIFTKKLVRFLSSLDLDCSPAERRYRTLSAMGDIKILITRSGSDDIVLHDFFVNSNAIYNKFLTNYNSVDFKMESTSTIVLSVKSVFFSSYYSKAIDEVLDKYITDITKEEKLKHVKIVDEMIGFCEVDSFHILGRGNCDIKKYHDTMVRQILPKILYERIENDNFEYDDIDFENDAAVDIISSISLEKLEKLKIKLLLKNELDVEYDAFF